MSGFTKGFGNLGQLVGSTAAAGLGNLVSGASDLFFGGIQARRNWKYQQKAMNLQQKYNLENMQKQFEYQQEAWNRENEYNDPRNAVMRWRLAGISPNAVYGNSPGGAGVAGSAGTPDSSNPSGVGNMDSSSRRPAMTPFEMMQMRMQERMTDAEVNLKNAQAKEAESRATGQENENSIFDLIKSAKQSAAGIAALEEKIKGIEAKWLEAEKAKDMEIKDSILRETDQRISNLMSDKAYKEQATEKLRSDMDLIKAQIATESSKQHNLDSSTEFNKARTKTENELRASLKSNTISKTALNNASALLENARAVGAISENRIKKAEAALAELDSAVATGERGFLRGENVASLKRLIDAISPLK